MTDKIFDPITSTFKTDDQKVLERYVMSGSFSNVINTINAPDTVRALTSLIKKDELTVSRYLVDVLQQNRAIKNDYALFGLALCVVLGSLETKRFVYNSLTSFCKIPTDLFSFVSSYEELNKKITSASGWGNGMKRAVARWYNDRSVKELIVAVTKFKQRKGWAHRDLLRLAHPKPPTKDHAALYKYITSGKLTVFESEIDDVMAFKRLEAIDRIHRTSDISEVVEIIDKEKLSWEHVPSEFLKSAEVWTSLLKNIKPKALIRNLGKLGSIGLLPASADLNVGALGLVCEKLSDPFYANSVGLHPIAALQAKIQYEKGCGDKGTLSWPVNKVVLASLEKLVENCYENITKTETRVMIGLDVSGSMDATAYGNMSAREIANALTLVLAKSCKDVQLGVFSSGFTTLKLSKDETLSSFYKKTCQLPFSATDCSLPIKTALDQNIDVDAFVIITDNQNNPGSGNPSKLLNQYRKKLGKEVKFVCVSICGGENRSLADPNDANSLEFSGFDASTPQLITNFLFNDSQKAILSEKKDVNVLKLDDCEFIYDDVKQYVEEEV